jgi:5-methylcytosine-specific restriction endonuclease McrA
MNSSTELKRRRRAEGLCHCGQPSVLGLRSCQGCREKRANARAVEVASRAEKACLQCASPLGVDYKPKGGKPSLFCSRECGERHRAERAKSATGRASAIAFGLCVECSGRFVMRAKSPRLFCSEECRIAQGNRRSAEFQRARRARIAKVVPRTCANARCGKQFSVTVLVGKGRKHCSVRCAKRQAKRGKSRHEARARRAGVPCDYSVRPDAVFRRCRWRCQLCGCATPQRLRGTTKPNAPELDHIVPIALGGGHTWDNVQLACRRCNSAKGAKPLGQLRLAV